MGERWHTKAECFRVARHTPNMGLQMQWGHQVPRKIKNRKALFQCHCKPSLPWWWRVTLFPTWALTASKARFRLRGLGKAPWSCHEFSFLPGSWVAFWACRAGVSLHVEKVLLDPRKKENSVPPCIFIFSVVPYKWALELQPTGAIYAPVCNVYKHWTLRRPRADTQAQKADSVPRHHLKSHSASEGSHFYTNSSTPWLI